MFIRVSGAEFTEKLNKAIKGKKEVVNFNLQGDTLYLQTMGVVRHNIRLRVLETDMTELNASYIMDKMIVLLNPNLDVELYFNGDLLNVTQSNFTFNAAKSYEEKIDNKAFSDLTYLPFDRSGLRNIVAGAKQMDMLARSLSVGYASLQFVKGSVFLMYSNMMMKWSASLVDMSISVDVLKWIIDNTEETSRYCFDEETRTLYFYVSKDEVLTTEVNMPNYMVAETYEKMLCDTQRQPLVTLGSKYTEQIEVIAKNYDKALVDVSFCEDGNIRIYIDNTVTRFTYGSPEQILKTIRISTVQLAAMLKILSKTKTDIEIGENKLWLRQPTRMTDLVVAGMIY